MIEFQVIKQHSHSAARLGRLLTPHGEIQTPVFMPVGTQGTVKAVFLEDLKLPAQFLKGLKDED